MSHLIDGLVGECKEIGIETLSPVELERMMIEYEHADRLIWLHKSYKTGGSWSTAGKEGYVEYKLIIPSRLDCLNDYIAAERTNRHKGAKMKADNGNIVAAAIRQCLRGVRIEKPVFMEYAWIEPNKRRDKDNISSFGRKVIQDTLVDTAVLKNDGWKYVVGFSDRFEVDKENPRIGASI